MLIFKPCCIVRTDPVVRSVRVYVHAQYIPCAEGAPKIVLRMRGWREADRKRLFAHRCYRVEKRGWTTSYFILGCDSDLLNTAAMMLPFFEKAADKSEELAAKVTKVSIEKFRAPFTNKTKLLFRISRERERERERERRGETMLRRGYRAAALALLVSATVSSTAAFTNNGR
jgi:hypothetical protein